MAIRDTIRSVVKASTSGSISMVIGGIVVAVIPPQVSILYKAAAFVGGTMVAWFTGDKLEGFVDEKMDDIYDVVDSVKAMAAEAKKNINEEEMEEA